MDQAKQNQTFEELGLTRPFIQSLEGASIVVPTDIQRLAIPVLLEGRDALLQSPTGSGKTLAYLLPALTRVKAEEDGLQALIVVPNQELGMQIYREIETHGGPAGIRGISLIGSASAKRQVDKLKDKPHVAVGTPGRIAELIEAKKLKMHQVRYIVMDEADQLFKLGEAGAVDRILKSALRDKQLVAVSATMTDAVKQGIGASMNEPALVKAEGIGFEDAKPVRHGCVVVDRRDKIDMLRKTVRALNPQASLVFVGEVEQIAEVTEKLKYAGLQAAALYGEAGKQERAAVMERYRKGDVRLIVTTDLGSRGLDLPDVTHVFHFDLPREAEQFIHRSGRTGRMGRAGMVIALIEAYQRQAYARLTKQAGVMPEEWGLFEGKLLPASEAAQRKGPRRSNPPQAGKRGQQSAPAKAKNRERDRKSKGAPKWMKSTD